MRVKCNNEECVSCNMELECILDEIELSDNGICLNADNVGDSEMKDDDEYDKPIKYDEDDAPDIPSTFNPLGNIGNPFGGFGGGKSGGGGAGGKW